MTKLRVSRILKTVGVGLVLLAAEARVSAYELTTLVSFPGNQLSGPSGALATDGSNLYGTTQGAFPTVGAVFRVGIAGSGLQAIRYMDYPLGGFDAYGGVTIAGSQVFGVTFRGGPATGSQIGNGTVFAMNLDGSNHQILRTFGNPSAPTRFPHETVLVDGSTLFGTTTTGSGSNAGAVYRVNADGSNFQTLHTFNGVNGSWPATRLQLVGGKLFGATAGFTPGTNGGTVFSINPDGTSFQVLHTFAGSDGINVEGDLALVGSTLYGVTTNGGLNGNGTIFRLNLDGSGFQTLHHFSFGRAPQSGLTLVEGRLFGTTTLGGSADYGTLFSFDPNDAQFETIHSFGGASGIYPATRLLAIGSTIYGVAEQGGTTGFGTIFALTIPEPSSICLAIAAGFVASAFGRRGYCHRRR